MKEYLFDATELEAPEPLEQATKLLNSLQHGEYIRMIHRKQPRLLYPIIKEQGYREQTILRDDGLVEILICFNDDQKVIQTIF